MKTERELVAKATRIVSSTKVLDRKYTEFTRFVKCTHTVYIFYNGRMRGIVIRYRNEHKPASYECDDINDDMLMEALKKRVRDDERITNRELRDLVQSLSKPIIIDDLPGDNYITAMIPLSIWEDKFFDVSGVFWSVLISNNSIAAFNGNEHRTVDVKFIADEKHVRGALAKCKQGLNTNMSINVQLGSLAFCLSA